MIRLREIRIKKRTYPETTGRENICVHKMYIYMGEWGTEPQHCNASKSWQRFSTAQLIVFLIRDGGTAMIIRTTLDMNLARKEYEKYRGSSSTPIFSSPQIISGNIDNLINSPAVERLVQSLAKLYIENKGMK